MVILLTSFIVSEVAASPHTVWPKDHPGGPGNRKYFIVTPIYSHWSDSKTVLNCGYNVKSLNFGVTKVYHHESGSIFSPKKDEDYTMCYTPPRYLDRYHGGHFQRSYGEFTKVLRGEGRRYLHLKAYYIPWYSQVVLTSTLGVFGAYLHDYKEPYVKLSKSGSHIKVEAEDRATSGRISSLVTRENMTSGLDVYRYFYTNTKSKAKVFDSIRSHLHLGGVPFPSRLSYKGEFSTASPYDSYRYFHFIAFDRAGRYEHRRIDIKTGEVCGGSGGSIGGGYIPPPPPPPPTISAKPSSNKTWLSEQKATLTFKNAATTRQARWDDKSKMSSKSKSCTMTRKKSAVPIGETKKFYIHASASGAGGKVTKKFGPYYIDNKPPTVSFGHSAPKIFIDKGNIKLTFKDSHAGLKTCKYRVYEQGKSKPSWSSLSCGTKKEPAKSKSVTLKLPGYGIWYIDVQAKDRCDNDKINYKKKKAWGNKEKTITVGPFVVCNKLDKPDYERWVYLGE